MLCNFVQNQSVRNPLDFDLWSLLISTSCNSGHEGGNSSLTDEIRQKFPDLFSEGIGCCTKDGKIPVCADYSTGLNDGLQPNKYPLPTPYHIF